MQAWPSVPETADCRVRLCIEVNIQVLLLVVFACVQAETHIQPNSQCWQDSLSSYVLNVDLHTCGLNSRIYCQPWMLAGAAFSVYTLIPLFACVQAEQFNYCQPWMLAWPYRKQNLLKEILSYDADILCLQVQNLSFSTDLQFFLLNAISLL